MTTLVSSVGPARLSDIDFESVVRAGREGVTTLADLPFHILEHFPGDILMRRSLGRGFLELTGAQIFEQVRALSLGLEELGVVPGDRVAIISDSRPEWTIADLASLAAGAVTVPVYPTQSSAQIQFVLSDSGAKVIVVSGVAQLEKIRRVRNSLPELELVLVIDAPADNERAYPDALPLAEVIAHGNAVLETDARAPERFRMGVLSRGEHQVATIVYTMDESGDLKGAMLTHANLLADLRATGERLPLERTDLALSLLPLSHVFERMALYRYLHDGVGVVFVESLMTVMRDLRRARPTVMTGVPRVYEKFFTAVQEELARASGLRRAVVGWALRVGEKQARLASAGVSAGFLFGLTHRVADRLILARIREAIGGRLRWLVSGSAALPARVSDFFASIGLPIYEGYGLTETSPVLTACGPGNMRRGTVGRPLPGVQIRIAEDGEILAHGPNVMVGYHRRPDLNETTLRAGWFRTGDIGKLDADGYLTITDRKKDLIVTAGGKKVAPAPLEAALMQSRLVADAILIGENRKFVSVLIVPDFEQLDAYLHAADLPAGAREDLVQRADVVQIYQNLVDRLNVGLSQFERIKRLALLPHDVTLLRGGAGPTMLKRRHAIELQFKHLVDRMYANAGKD